MALNIVRVLALPAELVPNTIYLKSVSATELQVVTVGNTAADVRSTIIGSDVDGKITTASNTLTTNLQAYADTAEADAIAAAAADATTKANAALASAQAYADTAEADAIAAAAADATSKADAAQAAAISAAATDATTKANAALASANSYTDGAISTAIGNLDLSNSALLVADIAARDLLELTKNSFVLVSDASADATVDVGSALYFYNTADDSYTKVAEYESMDVVIPNQQILSDFSDVAGQLYYKGAAVATVHAGASEW